MVAIPDGLVWAEGLGAAAMPGVRAVRMCICGKGSAGISGEGLMGFLFIWQFILSGPLEIGTGFIGFKQYLRFSGRGPAMPNWTHAASRSSPWHWA